MSRQPMSDGNDSPPIEDVDLGAVLHALSDPHRRRVVVELAREPERERSCASFNLPLAKSTRTHHWRALREAGLIHQRNAGNQTFLRLRRDELERRFPGLLDTLTRLAGDEGVDAASRPAQSARTARSPRSGSRKRPASSRPT